LQCIIDHFVSLPVIEDPDAHFGERHKEPYQFLVRKENLDMKESQYIRKTCNTEIQKVRSGRCCPKHCCQFFPQEHTLTIRQKFYLKSFKDRRKYGISAGGQMHSIEGNRKRKYFTLQGTEVCATAWYIIHGFRSPLSSHTLTSSTIESLICRTETKDASAPVLELYKSWAQ
jgi:hypothetical protein